MQKAGISEKDGSRKGREKIDEKRPIDGRGEIGSLRQTVGRSNIEYN